MELDIGRNPAIQTSVARLRQGLLPGEQFEHAMDDYTDHAFEPVALLTNGSKIRGSGARFCMRERDILKGC